MRHIGTSGWRRVRLGEKKKKRCVIFAGKNWHVPDGAKIVNDNVWCQEIYCSDSNEKVTVLINIGGVEFPDSRKT